MSSALTTIAGKLAERYSLGKESDVVATLKQTAFKGDASDAQMTALLIVADQYGLNPWTKEIYAFPDKKNGIIPVVGVDGWSRIINESPNLDGIEFRQSEKNVILTGAKECPEWIECILYRKDRTHPTIVREYLDEVYKAPFKNDKGYTNNGPWQTHTKRFLRHKSLIQCARLAFGFVGIYDEDEAHRIRESSVVDMGTVEHVEPEVKALIEYAQVDFDKNKEAWQFLVETGKKDKDALINAVKARGFVLTEDQAQVIHSWKEIVNEDA